MLANVLIRPSQPVGPGRRPSWKQQQNVSNLTAAEEDKKPIHMLLGRRQISAREHPELGG